MNTEDEQIYEMLDYLNEGARSAMEDAVALYNAGYRKASDVAREIAEEILEMAECYGGGILFWRKMKRFAVELKEIYTEGERTQAVYKHRTPNGATYITAEPVSAENEDTE